MFPPSYRNFYILLIANSKDHWVQRIIFVLLKELPNCILRTSLVWSFFYLIRVYKSRIFYQFFWKTSFFCLSVLFVITACSEFDVLLINFCNISITIIYIIGVTFFCSHLSLIIFKQFVRTDTRHKNLTIPRNKICLLGAFSSKNFIYKEKYETFTKSESVKETLSANKFLKKV